MPVIKQSTRSSNVIVSSSGKNASQRSNNDISSSSEAKSQKEIEYRIRLDTSIFKKNAKSEMLRKYQQTSSSPVGLDLDIEEFSDLRTTVSNFDDRQRIETQSPSSRLDRLSSSIPENRITIESQDSIDNERSNQLSEVFRSLPNGFSPSLVEVDTSYSPESEVSSINETFNFTSLGKLINRSRKSLENTNIKVLSHEVFKLNKQTQEGTSFDSNLLFLDTRSQANLTLISLKNSEIEKKETFSDRLFVYVDDFKHNNLIEKSHNESISLVNQIDQTSTIGNKLENEINYGNIIENFIKEGKSNFIGKISNQILLNSKNYNTLTGKDDEVLLDLQTKTFKSVLNKENLEIFYKNITGFSYKEKNSRFSNSISNFKIVNTDRLVGQLMVNYSVGHNSIYPNSDDVASLEYHDSQVRKKINGSAFNKYPIIQFKDININSRIFSNKKLEFIAVNGNSLNIDKILRNVDRSLVDEKYIPGTVIKSFLFFSGNEINSIGDKYNEGEDINTRGTSYRNRKSFAGKKNSSANVTNETDNNIFSILLEDNSPDGARDGFPINTDSEFLFEKIYLDVDTKYEEENNYLLPSFLKLPTRYFSKSVDGNNTSNAVERFNDSTLLVNRAIANLSLRGSSLQSIKNSIENSLLIGYSLTLPGQEISDAVYNDRLSFIRARDTFLDVIASKYFKFANRRDYATLNNKIRIKGSVTSTSLESYIDEYIVRKKDNNSTDIARDSNDFGSALLSEASVNIDDNISSRFNESLKDSGNIYASVEDEIKNDCFIFSTSNSFLNKEELDDVIISNYNNKKIEDLGLNLVKTKQIKKAKDRFLNRVNTTDNVLSVFNGENNISLLTLKISNVVNLVRKSLSDNKKFESIFNKAKSKVIQQDNFTLLYDSFKENCLDTFDESPFITSKGFYKNNFVEEFSLENKNTTKLIIDKDNDIEDNDIFTSKEFRKYLSQIYTNSFVRNKSTLLNRILKDNIDMFELKNGYPKSFNNISNYFGFDVLLAKSLAGVNSNNSNEVKDVCKVILANSIIKSCGIDNQISQVYKEPVSKFIGESNKKILNKDISDNLRKVFGEEIINNFVNVVFNKENIHSMNNKIIRSVDSNSMKSIIDFNLTSVDAINGLQLEYVNGNMCELVFPGYYAVNRFGEGGIKSVSTKAIRNASTINSELLDEESIETESEALKRSLSQAGSNMLYNYDVFVDDLETGVVFYEKDEEDASFSRKGFNFIKEEVNKGIDLRIAYNLFKEVKSDDVGLTGSQSGKAVSPYRRSLVYIPMSYFFLSGRENTFSKKITSICTDLTTVFDIKYDNINNVEEVIEFIDNNSYLLRIIQDILEAFSIVYIQSFENYNTYIEEKIRLETINKDMSVEEFKNVVKDYNILNASVKDRSFCVSDIKEILDKNIENIEEPKYQTSDFIIQNSPVVNNRETVYSKRFFELQIVNKIIQNSDISEAVCLDIIHGYFSSLESNKSLESESKDNLDNNIEEINKIVNSIQNLSLINIQEHIFDEFYQNKLSKDIQEIMFYKNIFNETFIRNNLYNSNRQKYENENVFNHRKLFYLNSYNRGIQSLNQIGKYLSKENSELDKNTRNLDVLKIPIDFKVANRIGTRGFLKISIQPVNLKYPEIEYKTIAKYYTPMLTGLTSNFMSSLSNNFFNFCGIYNDTQKISERYNVVSKDIAILEVKEIVDDIFSLNAEENQQDFILDTEALSTSVYDDNIISSAVSHLDFITQSPLNENIKVDGESLDNLISKETVKLMNSIDIENLRKSIEKIDESILSLDFIENDKEYAQSLSNSEILRNNEFYHKFIKDLDRDISQQDLVLAMIPNNIYDVFNIVIDRDLISIDTGSSKNEITDMGLDIFNDRVSSHNKNLCISYYISFEVL